MLGDVGGLMEFLYVVIGLVVFQFSDININCSILFLFDFLLEKDEHIDKEGGACELKRMAAIKRKKQNQFQSYKFQAKMFVYNKLCCSNRLAEKLI